MFPFFALPDWFSSNVTVIIDVVIAEAMLLMATYAINQKWFRPKMVVKPYDWGGGLYFIGGGNGGTDWYCDLKIGNEGRRTAHKVKATMTVDTPSYEGPNLKREWVELEGKRKTFILFSDEEIPPVKVDRDFKTVKLVFHEGDETLSVERQVVRPKKDGVLEITEEPEKFPARDTTIEITLDGENLREKDMAIRQFYVKLPNPETGEFPSPSAPIALLWPMKDRVV